MNDRSNLPAAEATAPATGDAHPQPGDAASPAGTVAIGQLVITWDDDEPRAYGGLSDHPGFTEVSFGLFDGRTPVIKCDPQRVAPADTPIPARDARLTVEQRPRAERPYGAAGNWRLTLPGQLPSWHKTKRDGTAAGLRPVGADRFGQVGEGVAAKVGDDRGGGGALGVESGECPAATAAAVRVGAVAGAEQPDWRDDLAFDAPVEITGPLALGAAGRREDVHRSAPLTGAA